MAIYLRLAALLSGLTLSGCATVKTTGVDQGKSGISYHLPKGQFEVTVVDDAGTITVSLAGPVIVPDPRFPLIARLPRSGTSDNLVTVDVDPKTDLISKIDITSTGQLSTIVKNVAETVAFLQAADSQSGSIVFDHFYDLADLPVRATGEVNAFIDAYYSHVCESAISDAAPLKTELTGAGYSPDSQKADRKARLQYCQKLRTAGLGSARSDHMVSISVAASARSETKDWYPLRPAVATIEEAGKLCRDGICYRPLTGVAIDLTVAGAFSRAGTFLVPDETRLQNLPLPQGVFAEQKYSVTFAGGVPTEYQQNSKSELVGLSELPLDVVKAVLSAPAEALGLKTANLKAQADYLSQLAVLQTSQQSITKTCQASPNLCPATALKIIKGSIGTPGGVVQTGATVTDQGATGVVTPASGALVVNHDSSTDH